MPRMVNSTALALWLIAALGSPALAADEATDFSGKPDELRAAIAKAAAHPPDPGQTLATARTRLADSLDELDRTLSASDAENERGWRQWLDVPALRAELAKTDVNAAALKSLERRYYQNQPGLELPVLVAVRQRLGEFLTAWEYASADAPHELFRRRLKELEQCQARLAREASDADAQRAGLTAAWLAPLGEEGRAVASAMRALHGQANGNLQVSRQFINHLMAQDIQEQTFISDIILGTQTSGLAYTQGRVSFDLVPNRERGTLEVCLEGQTACPDNVAQRGRVAVHSSAQTVIRARKQVHISDLGLTLAPAVAACTTSLQIDDVEAQSRIIERVAWRRASQLLPQAEQAASQRAQTEASGKLDERASAALGGANNFFCEKFRAPLIRIGALPASLQFWTESSHLRLSLVQRSDTQLATATAAPSLPSEYDLAGCAHESLVNNFCESALGGATIADRDWMELMNLLTGAAPRHLWVHDRAERWSVAFARQRPVLVRFAEDRIGLTFRLESVTRGASRSELPVEIEARFVPQITVDGPAFRRDGDVQVRFERETNSPEERQARSLLEAKFAAVLPAELHLNGLVPPAGGSLGKLRQLELAEFRSTGGWLTLGYKLGGADLGELDSRQALDDRTAR